MTSGDQGAHLLHKGKDDILGDVRGKAQAGTVDERFTHSDLQERGEACDQHLLQSFFQGS